MEVSFRYFDADKTVSLDSVPSVGDVIIPTEEFEDRPLRVVLVVWRMYEGGWGHCGPNISLAHERGPEGPDARLYPALRAAGWRVTRLVS